MKTILAPTDFSEVSINAVNYAADMAAATGAKLLVLHAVEVPVAVGAVPVAAIDYEELSTENELMELRKSLLARTNHKITIDAKHLWGTIENELTKICGYNKPFAIVMGTHGDGLAERYFLESTTVYIAKHFPNPVLVVPRGKSFSAIQKIVLATDLKDVDNLPEQQIADLVNIFNAGLDIVYVNKNGSTADAEAVESLFLDHPLKKLNPRFHVVENNNVLKGISSFAEQNNADLVLILPKKHRFFHRSDSRQFIFHSQVPVMAIHKE